MKHETFDRTPVRELTAKELILVGGGAASTMIIIDNNRNGYFDDGDDIVITATADQSGWWEIGGAFGIGFGLYGHGDQWGISFNAGFGVYAGAGLSSTEEARQVEEEEVIVGFENNTDPVVRYDPNTRTVTVSVGGAAGVIAKSPKP